MKPADRISPRGLLAPRCEPGAGIATGVLARAFLLALGTVPFLAPAPAGAAAPPVQLAPVLLASASPAAGFAWAAAQASPSPGQATNSGQLEQADVRSGREKGREAGNENDQFRHSKAVQTLAGWLHMDVESAAKLFEYVNAGILWLAILIPLFRFLPRALRRRREELARELAEARRQSGDADSRLKAVEERMARLDEEIAGFRRQVEEESRADEEHIRASIAAEKQRILASVGEEMERAAAAAERELRQLAASLAVDRAAHSLNLSEEADRQLVSEFARSLAAPASGSRN